MNFKERIAKIKLMFSEEVPPALPEVPPVIPVKQSIDVTTTDGKNLSVDVMQVGGIVTMDFLPVEDSTYTLSDGTSFSTKNGVIDTITPSAAPLPVVDEEMKKQMAVMQQKFAAIEVEKKNEIKALKAEVEKNKNLVKEMFAALELVGESSSQKPIENNVDWDKLSPLERRRILKQN
jgi:hypothetical protein